MLEDKGGGTDHPNTRAPTITFLLKRKDHIQFFSLFRNNAGLHKISSQVMSRKK
jgi:hypothetical protein